MAEAVETSVITRRPSSPGEQLFQLSRRHKEAFSVVALTPVRGGPDALRLLCDTHRQSRPFPEATDALGLRETDLLLGHVQSGRYWILCPHTNAEGAKELVCRLRGMLQGDALVEFGAASFPDDAQGLDDLVDLATLRGAGSARQAGSAHDAWGEEREIIAHRAAKISGRTPIRKRLFDLVLVLGTSPVWAVLLGLIAAAIKLSEPDAPVFFKQMRTGRGGRRFPMYKFRTMIPNAEEEKQKLLHLNKLQLPDFKIDNDPRITQIGRFLRATSLDELPQLLNVVTGEMSVVGPRPTSFPVQTYEPWQTARLDITPGITGLWQIEGRGSAEFDERLRLDIEYIEKQSLAFDLWILLRTVTAVIHRRGA